MTAPALELIDLFIYPVKSLRGVRLNEAAIEHGRLVGDRNWLLVDAAGEFMHMRDFPQMARVSADLTPRGIRVQADGMGALDVDRPDVTQNGDDSLTHVRLWRRSAPVVAVSQEADAWFTEALGERCRLMAFVSDARALNVPSYEVDSSLQDATPFHLTTEESLADLNARMAAPIPMHRFRPNVVVRGGAAYAEDHWRRIAIGGTTLRWIKPCTRCVATTTDHLTGERSTRDPLVTLARYRRIGPAVVFGHYLVAESWGSPLRVGDSGTVLD